MALTLTFTFTAPCSGGNHFTATGTLSTGQKRTLQLDRAGVTAAPTLEEIDAFLRVLLKLYAGQLTGTSAAQIGAAVAAKTLDLTVTG